MDTLPQDHLPTTDLDESALSRRKFLRNAALTGGGLVAAAGLAACRARGRPGLDVWSVARGGERRPRRRRCERGGLQPRASMAMSPAPARIGVGLGRGPGGPMPTGWTEHDIAARDVVRRYIGNLAPALKGIYGDAIFTKLADILGAADNYPQLSQKPAFVQVPQLFLNDALKPLKPELDGDVKVFRLTIDEIEQHIDELMPPVAALGYNGQWPGPDDPRQPGRQGPGDLHQQPEGDDRRPLPRRRVRRLLPGRRPVRDPEADHPGRVVHLRVHRRERRLADVPLAPQRDRPGRPRACWARSSWPPRPSR